MTGNTFGAKIKFFNGLKFINFIYFNNDNLNIFFRGADTAYTSHDLTIAENVANDPSFNLTRTTMIYIHGWHQSPSSPCSQIVINAYINNGRYNILVLDWSQAASGAFAAVQFRVDEVCIK